jgi:MoaA/NifB/PqqE/SkfB family radical SAM enzyme
MLSQSLYHTYKRYRTLQTDKITALPIVILMPHSACNCRCVMCDIWKDNQNLKQLTESDIQGMLDTFRRFDTKQVVMSGGEALLHPNFFRFCEILGKESIRVSLLSTGITLKKYAEQLVDNVYEVIVSLDGAEGIHDTIRNIPGAFKKLGEGVQFIKSLKTNFRITARSVIHRLNFQQWPAIIDNAKEIGLDQISFLPADVSSHAFNREILWSNARQHEILLSKDDLPELKNIVEYLLYTYKRDFENKFIAESSQKIQKIYEYYAAFYGLNPFPYKKCNAPWVSAVVEADGSVRPCFFHESFGNIHNGSLDGILNSDKAIEFRKNLDMNNNDICKKCVCYLNLPPRTNPVTEN